MVGGRIVEMSHILPSAHLSYCGCIKCLVASANFNVISPVSQMKLAKIIRIRTESKHINTLSHIHY